MALVSGGLLELIPSIKTLNRLIFSDVYIADDSQEIELSCYEADGISVQADLISEPTALKYITLEKDYELSLDPQLRTIFSSCRSKSSLSVQESESLETSILEAIRDKMFLSDLSFAIFEVISAYIAPTTHLRRNDVSSLGSSLDELYQDFVDAAFEHTNVDVIAPEKITNRTTVIQLAADKVEFKTLELFLTKRPLEVFEIVKNSYKLEKA